MKLLLSAALVLGVGTASAHELITRTVNGRETLVYLPDDYETRTEPMQVLLALHPATSSASGFRKMTAFENRPAATDVIVVYANGSKGIAPGLSWDGAELRKINRGDMEYLLAVIADVATIAPTKPKFAVVGFSAGSFMTYRMLCAHGSKISAAVPYGAYFGDSVIANTSSCPWPTTVPLMHMHGTADAPTNPLTGTGLVDSIYNFGILSDHMTVVASRNNGQHSVPDFAGVEAELRETVTVVNTATSYVLLNGVGHYWPGLYASDAVLEFITQF